MPTLIVAFVSLLAALIPVDMVAQSTPPPGDVPLADSTWRMEDANGDISEAVPFAITFLADGTVLVATNCPQATGTFTGDGNGMLNIDLLDEAMADCDDEEATVLLAAVEQASTFSIDENGLLTVDLADGEAYVFSPALIEVTWQWVEFQSSNNRLVTPADSDVHQVTFHQDGSVEVVTPCATGTGTFTDSANGLDVDLSALDTTACSEDSPSSLLLRDIDMSTSYVIRDGHLFVALPMDGGIHEFAPVYSAESGA